MVSVNPEKTTHWILVVIDQRRKQLRTYDSKGYEKPKGFLDPLVRFIVREHHDKKKVALDWTEWKSFEVEDIPRQGDDQKCGVFV